MRDELKMITLPSGKEAEVRKGKGRDLMRAHRAVAGNPEPMSVSFALIAELVLVEGKVLVYEDILEIDLDDVLTLENELAGSGESQENFSKAAALKNQHIDHSQPRQSSDSSDSGSHSRNY